MKNDESPMRDYAQSLPMALLVTREAVMRRFRPNLRSHDLTEQQWRVLRVLMESPRLEVTQLAEHTCILSPSLSRILATMENKTLIRRNLLPSDQRRSVISISKKGMNLFKVVAAESEQIYSGIEGAVGKKKMSTLLDALQHVREALS